METKEIINKLINGETVIIIDNLQFCQVRNELRKIKENCNIVLSQMNETIKSKKKTKK